MNGEINLLTLLSLVVAVIAIVKLRSVLGRRTPDDDARIEQRRRDAQMQKTAAANASDKVVALPRREREPEPQDQGVSVAEVEARIKSFAGEDVTLAAQMAGARLDHMPILRETLAAFTEGKSAGWGGEDFSGVTHVVEKRFGRKVSER